MLSIAAARLSLFCQAHWPCERLFIRTCLSTAGPHVAGRRLQLLRWWQRVRTLRNIISKQLRLLLLPSCTHYFVHLLCCVGRPQHVLLGLRWCQTCSFCSVSASRRRPLQPCWVPSTVDFLSCISPLSCFFQGLFPLRHILLLAPLSIRFCRFQSPVWIE